MDKFGLGLPLLREDIKFIETALRGQHPDIVNAALEDYALVWRKAAAVEPVEHIRANAGRRAANTFLRVVICPSF